MITKKERKFDNMMTILLSVLIIIALTIVFTSCGTSKRAGGCGGNPIHLGN